MDGGAQSGAGVALPWLEGEAVSARLSLFQPQKLDFFYRFQLGWADHKSTSKPLSYKAIGQRGRRD
jgi:hypothetical protein